MNKEPADAFWQDKKTGQKFWKRILQNWNCAAIWHSFQAILAETQAVEVWQRGTTRRRSLKLFNNAISEIMRLEQLYLLGFFNLFIYFEEYLVRGAQFSQAGLNVGPWWKEKTTQKTITAEKNGTTKHSESIEGSIWLGSKIAFWGQTQTYLNHARSSGPEEACSRSWLRWTWRSPGT